MQISVIEIEIYPTEMRILVFKYRNPYFRAASQLEISICQIQISAFKLEISVFKLNSGHLHLKYRFL